VPSCTRRRHEPAPGRSLHEAIGDARSRTPCWTGCWRGRTALSSSASPCAGARRRPREAAERQVIAQGDSTVRVSPPTSLVTPECFCDVHLQAEVYGRPRSYERTSRPPPRSRCRQRHRVGARRGDQLAREIACHGRAGQRRRRSSPSHELDRRGGETAERCRCSSTRPGYSWRRSPIFSESPGECVAALRRASQRRPEAGRGQAVNGGVGQFPLSEIEPDQRAISTRSTASFSACKLSIKHREGGELTG